MPICLPIVVDAVTNVGHLAVNSLVVQSLVHVQNLVHVQSLAVLNLVVQNLAVQNLAVLSLAVLSLAAQHHAHVLSLAAKHAANQYADVVTDAVLAADVMVMVTMTAEKNDKKRKWSNNNHSNSLHKKLLLLSLVQEALTKSFSDKGCLSHRAEAFA
jgi:hypothetical protein